MIGYSKKIEKIIQENAFDKKKKKPGLKFNPGLALTGVRTAGLWRLGLRAPLVARVKSTSPKVLIKTLNCLGTKLVWSRRIWTSFEWNPTTRKRGRSPWRRQVMLEWQLSIRSVPFDAIDICSLFFICYTLTRRSSALIKFQPLSTKTSSLVIPAFEIFRQVQGLRKFSSNFRKRSERSESSLGVITKILRRMS